MRETRALQNLLRPKLQRSEGKRRISVSFSRCAGQMIWRNTSVSNFARHNTSWNNEARLPWWSSVVERCTMCLLCGHTGTAHTLCSVGLPRVPASLFTRSTTHLDDLGHAVAEFSLWKSEEESGIDENVSGLVEGADQVLAGMGVDRCLAANAAVDHGQERSWDLADPQAAHELVVCARKKQQRA